MQVTEHLKEVTSTHTPIRVVPIVGGMARPPSRGLTAIGRGHMTHAFADFVSLQNGEASGALGP